jgi:photosystem II stability/assembly factor-like uncharacterized protein
MKTTSYILSLFLIALVFSGCTSSKTTVIPTFTLNQSIWKSTDGGANWEVKNKGEGKANVTNADVLSVAFNSFDGNNIYVGLRAGGILETIDGGTTWKFINYTSEKVYGLALSPTDGRTLYASGVWQGTGKIFKTQDDGKNWTEIYTSPSPGPLIISLVIDKKNANIIYATTSTKEAIKSTDGGTTWKNIYLSDDPIVKISIDAFNSKLLYFMTSAGKILRSKDGGENFEDISGKISKDFFSFGNGRFSILKVDPSKANNVYLAGSAGIMLSKDGGESWQGILALNNVENFPIRALAISPKNSEENSEEIVYAMDQATYKSVDGGKNWKTFQFNNKMKASIMEYNPAGEGELYIGFAK